MTHRSLSDRCFCAVIAYGRCPPGDRPVNAIVPLRLRFSRADRITLNGTSYRLVEASNSGHVLVHVDDPDVVEEFSHEQIHKLNAQGEDRKSTRLNSSH